ncbi:hypothetical protein BGX33_003186, partial [Mortierella sp. NVP41]
MYRLDPLRIAAIPDAVLHVTVERQPITTEDEIDDEVPLSKKPLSEDPVITVTLPGSEYGILEVATPDYTNKPTPLSTNTAQHLSDQPDDENNNSPKDAHPPNNSSTLSSSSIQIDNIEQLIAEAGLGGASAQVRLGTIYRDGEGVPQDYAQAMEYFSMAADQGHVSAQAADQGYVLGQNSIGAMYYMGQGVPKNHQKAIEWFLKAADQDDARAQYYLGIMRRIGEGIPQDYQKAMKWLLKAADQGYANAQQSIGFMHQNGLGVPQEYSTAME